MRLSQFLTGQQSSAMNNRFPYAFTGWKWWLLILSASAYLYTILHVFWRYGDEGLVLYGSQLVLEGKLPYRDFFEVFGPGSFYWTGFFFKFFGIHLITARTLLLVTGVTLVLLPMWMTRRICRGPFELFPPVFLLLISIPIWPACSHHWDSNLFLFISLTMFLLWQDTGNPFFLSMSGIFSGLTYCFLQQKGLLLLLSFIVSILIINYLKDNHMKILFNLFLILGCYSAVIITVFIFFYINGGLNDMVYDTVLWPFNFYKQVNIVPYGFGLREFLWKYYEKSLSPLPSGLAISISSSILIFPYLLIFLLPFIVIGLCFFCIKNKFYRTRVFNVTTIPYWVVGIALWLSEAHRPDIYHLVWGSPIIFILFYLIMNVIFANRKNILTFTFGVLLITSFTLGMFNLLQSSTAREKIVSRRGSFYSYAKDGALDFLLRKTKEGEYVFIYPYNPMYYFLADVKNPTRYNNLIYNYHNTGQFEESIAALEQKKVQYILWDTVVAGWNLRRWFPHYKHPEKGSLIMERYIRNNYNLVDMRNGFRIMERKQYRSNLR
jgi:hypothetical protein